MASRLACGTDSHLSLDVLPISEFEADSLSSRYQKNPAPSNFYWISLRKHPGRGSLVDVEASALPRLVGSAGHGYRYHSSRRGSVESHVLPPVVAIHTADASVCVEAWSRSMLVCQNAFLDVIRSHFV
jgi:hypothetical protein